MICFKKLNSEPIYRKCIKLENGLWNFISFSDIQFVSNDFFLSNEGDKKSLELISTIIINDDNIMVYILNSDFDISMSENKQNIKEIPLVITDKLQENKILKYLLSLLCPNK